MNESKVKKLAASCDCRVCEAITSQDLYVSAKSPEGADWREIIARYGPKPCQCGCGQLVHIGARCMQKTGVGVRIIGHGL